MCLQGHQLEQQKGEMEARRAAAAKEHSERMKAGALLLFELCCTACSCIKPHSPSWQPCSLSAPQPRADELPLVELASPAELHMH